MSDLKTLEISLGRRQFIATEPVYARLKRVLAAIEQANKAGLVGDMVGGLDGMLRAIIVMLEVRHPEATFEAFEELPIKPDEIEVAFEQVCGLARLKKQEPDPNGLAATGGTGTSTTPT